MRSSGCYIHLRNDAGGRCQPLTPVLAAGTAVHASWTPRRRQPLIPGDPPACRAAASGLVLRPLAIYIDRPNGDEAHAARFGKDRQGARLLAQREGLRFGGLLRCPAGALQLLADVEARFRTPAGGGRPTGPRWTERRLVPLAPRTLERLEEITAEIRSHGAVNLEPMQLAALLLERMTEQLSGDEAEDLVDAAL